MSSESLTTSTSLAPSARARARPSSSPRYSATLFVATPIGSAASSSTSPAGVETTAPAAAGPGLPRAPPSTCTTTFIAVSPGSARGDARKLAGHALAAAVALLALLGGGRIFVRAPPLGLAAVDDHGHV